MVEAGRYRGDARTLNSSRPNAAGVANPIYAGTHAIMPQKYTAFGEMSEMLAR